jgi:anti-sigma factor RsiW
VRRKRLQRELDALRDGALPTERAARLEALLASDSVAGADLRRTRALGSMVREAWPDGPAAPDSERLLAALRPELRRIDAEVGTPSPLRSWLATVLDTPRLVPTLATTGAAFALAVAFFSVPVDDTAVQLSVRATLPAAQLAVGRASEPTVYDLETGVSSSVMVYEQDGSTLLWLNEGADGLSSAPAVASRV